MTNPDAHETDVPSELIERFAAGEVAAFNAFHRMMLPAARRVARSIVHDVHLVDDAVQEASLKAWRAAPGFRAGDGRAWFLRIVRNTSLNMVARRARTDVVAAESIADQAGRVQQRRGSDHREVEAGDVATFTASFVHEAWFRRLAPRDQRILLLRSLGFPNAEIMRLVPGVTHNEIIRRALARAARNLRQDPGTLAIGQVAS